MSCSAVHMVWQRACVLHWHGAEQDRHPSGHSFSSEDVLSITAKGFNATEQHRTEGITVQSKLVCTKSVTFVMSSGAPVLFHSSGSLNLELLVQHTQFRVLLNVQAAEKVESGKAAAIAGVAGGLASLPYILAAGHPPISAALSAAVCLVSCTLFGVTFRYAIRQDLQNLQLKVLVCWCTYHVVSLTTE